MKPLILSFFLVILAYSLFFDKEKDEKEEVTPSTINTRSTHINSTDTTMNADSIIFYANKSVDPYELNF